MSIKTFAHAPRRFTDSVDVADMQRFDDWCRTLGCTRNQLAAAVDQVGGDADAVRTYFRQRRRS